MTAIRSSDNDVLVETPSGAKTLPGDHRLDDVDMLRGLVIVLMVLDHVRDFFGSAALHDPTDPSSSWPLLFATRWVTHLCAPTFVLLAGAAIAFQRQRSERPRDLARLLLLRGCWLLLLEATVVSFGFNFGEPFVFLQVIWAIGFGMICMSLIAMLPGKAVLGIGVLTVGLSPLALHASAGWTGVAEVIRTLLLAPGFLPGVPSLVLYPALPWLGVMCIGFGLAPMFQRPTPVRSRSIAWLAMAFLTIFLVLRTLNAYGDPSAWTIRPDRVRSAMSFLDLSKYPPSPDYVLATLGVSLLAYVPLRKLRGAAARILRDFGRTPLFTYIAHIYVAHGLMLVVATLLGEPQAASDFISGQTSDNAPTTWGFSLTVVYVVWVAVVAVLIPPSRWFAALKRRRRSWWMSYL